MRTFIAIDLSNEVKREIEQKHNVIKDNCSKSRITCTGNLHITLKFLGETTGEQLQNVKQIMNEIASNHKRFKLSLANWGCFKSKKGKIVWVGVNGDIIQLNDLAKHCHEALGNLAKDNRFNFKPHITVARDAFLINDISDWQKIKPLNFTIKHITLYESVFNNRKVSYVSRHRVDLIDNSPV